MKRADYPGAIKLLIAELKRMPGIGPRSAERIALWMIQSADARPTDIARIIGETTQAVHACPQCAFFTTEALCEICADENREAKQLCIIEQRRKQVRSHESRGSRDPSRFHRPTIAANARARAPAPILMV